MSRASVLWACGRVSRAYFKMSPGRGRGAQGSSPQLREVTSITSGSPESSSSARAVEKVLL